jgi:DNA-binding transcriptional ArsR family regulator
VEVIPALNELELEAAKVKDAALVFRAINNKLRQRLLRLLHENKGIEVTSIYRKIGKTQSTVSSHLGILRRAGLVTTSRDKRFVYYSVNFERLEEVGAIAKRLFDGQSQSNFTRWSLKKDDKKGKPKGISKSSRRRTMLERENSQSGRTTSGT